jgi:hydrogenase nickel incorporation protein HypA/HybF
LEVKLRGLSIRCRSCGLEFGDADLSSQLGPLSSSYGENYPMHLIPNLLPAFARCPHCGSHDLATSGLEFRIEEVETE